MTPDKKACINKCGAEVFFHEKWLSKFTGKQVAVEEYDAPNGEKKWRQHKCPNAKSYGNKLIEEKLSKIEDTLTRIEALVNGNKTIG